MARWEPGARERLVFAAVDLFTEQGYDATTVTEIAARAGVTKSTFFRYFPDKREILVAGQETLSELLARGIADAAGGSEPARGRGQRPRAGLERDGSHEPRSRPPHEGGRGRQHGAPGARCAQESGPGRSDDRCSRRRGCPGPDGASRQRDGSPRVQAGLRRVVRRRSPGRSRPRPLHPVCPERAARQRRHRWAERAVANVTPARSGATPAILCVHRPPPAGR